MQFRDMYEEVNLRLDELVSYENVVMTALRILGNPKVGPGTRRAYTHLQSEQLVFWFRTRGMVQEDSRNAALELLADERACSWIGLLFTRSGIEPLTAAPTAAAFADGAMFVPVHEICRTSHRGDTTLAVSPSLSAHIMALAS